MFEGANFRDTYKTSDGLKAFYWGFSPYTKKHYLTIKGAYIAIQVDDDGKNNMVYNDDYYGFEKMFKVDIIGKWEENS